MPRPDNIHAFFATHPVFTLDALKDHLSAGGHDTRSTYNRVHYHAKTGRLVSPGRGLYAVVPLGAAADSFAVDPYLVASLAGADAVIGMHSALELHGVAYSAFNEVTAFTTEPREPWTWRGVTYRTMPHPVALRRQQRIEMGTMTMHRGGLHVLVTTLERTLVDVLRTPDAAGGLEEVWRSLSSIQYLRLQEVVEYVQALGVGVTAARVGLFLERHRHMLGVSDEILRQLEELVPRSTQYLTRQRRQAGTLVPRWNLMVPAFVLENAWEELTALSEGGDDESTQDGP